jgi:hypothetical protein
MRDLAHARLHNGTIWRWNRPLIGFSPQGDPHVRIEHRPVPAGPTVADMVANAALYFGLVQMLATQPDVPEVKLSFQDARANFYAAAQHGLQAEVIWLQEEWVPIRSLLLEVLLPTAQRGLEQLGIDPVDINYYLGIIRSRLLTGQNGATWQRNFVSRYGTDMKQLTRTYWAHQQSGIPVHEWDL